MEIPPRAVRHFPVVKHKNEGKKSQTLKSFWGIVPLILGRVCGSVTGSTDNRRLAL